VPYLSASAVVIHYEEALYQVYAPLPLLRDLHWLRSRERIDFKLAVVVYRCLHGLASCHLSNHFQRVARYNRRRLRSASSSSLLIRPTRLITVGDRAFQVAGSHLWNSLPHVITSAPTLAVYRNRLENYLYSRSFTH